MFFFKGNSNMLLARPSDCFPGNVQQKQLKKNKINFITSPFLRDSPETFRMLLKALVM